MGLGEFEELHGDDFPIGAFAGADLDELDGVALVAIECEAALDEEEVFAEEVGVFDGVSAVVVGVAVFEDIRVGFFDVIFAGDFFGDDFVVVGGFFDEGDD